MNQDLTVGKPRKVLLRFCLPLFASVLFQQLYNIADSFVAGKLIDNNALAAVGNSYEITLIFIAFAFGCNIGCSVVVSRLFGAKQYEKMKTAVYSAFLACGMLCALLMIFGLFFGERLLSLINTPAELFADSEQYLDIYLLGLPFVFFYNVTTGIFSALGDSKTPFWFLACSSVSNIAVDILFVASFHMGVEGVAWATFFCQGVSCVLSLLFVFRRLGKIKTAKKPALFSWKLLGEITVIAVPSILQQSFVSLGNIAIQGVINGFGTAVIAGYAASVKLNNMVITSLVTLANGISNFTAQNIGAGKNERIREGFHAGLRIVWTLCLPIAAFYFFAGNRLVFLFLDSPAGDAVNSGSLFLKILAPFYFVVSAKLVADGVLRGAGKMKPFLISTFTDLILRVAGAILLSRTSLGSSGIWISWPIGWGIATAISVCFCRKNLTKRRQ